MKISDAIYAECQNLSREMADLPLAASMPVNSRIDSYPDEEMGYDDSIEAYLSDDAAYFGESYKDNITLSDGSEPKPADMMKAFPEAFAETWCDMDGDQKAKIAEGTFPAFMEDVTRRAVSLACRDCIEEHKEDYLTVAALKSMQKQLDQHRVISAAYHEGEADLSDAEIKAVRAAVEKGIEEDSFTVLNKGIAEIVECHLNNKDLTADQELADSKSQSKGRGR